MGNDNTIENDNNIDNDYNFHTDYNMVMAKTSTTSSFTILFTSARSSVVAKGFEIWKT